MPSKDVQKSCWCYPPRPMDFSNGWKFVPLERRDLSKHSKELMLVYDRHAYRLCHYIGVSPKAKCPVFKAVSNVDELKNVGLRVVDDAFAAQMIKPSKSADGCFLSQCSEHLKGDHFFLVQNDTDYDDCY